MTGTSPAGQCQCCGWHLRGDGNTGRQVCRRCQTALDADLAQVAELWVRLGEHLERLTGVRTDPDLPRHPGPTGSQAPGDLAVISLRAGGVTSKLLVHEEDWRRQLGWTLTPWRGDQDETLAGVLRFLRDNLHWACHAHEHDVHLDMLSTDLYELLWDMTGAITGDRRRPHALSLPCPASTGTDPDGTPAVCGGTLWFEPRHNRLRCRSCRQIIGHQQWVDISLAAGLLTPDDAAHLPDFTSP
ncbi:hypothetical protein [Streptantibioticus cattleyicolor]|uniref:hypothetical protein n=1 Tax=Streptantibioticus cattleyicolor TaxID=29303 RepID=UPI000A9ADB7B|nr:MULTISPECIES: hypothetical protein [Streptomycetaceae]